jgi:hypothetical protein
MTARNTRNSECCQQSQTAQRLLLFHFAMSRHSAASVQGIAVMANCVFAIINFVLKMVPECVWYAGVNLWAQK